MSNKLVILSRECIRDTYLAKRHAKGKLDELILRVYNQNMRILRGGQLRPYTERKMLSNRYLAKQFRKRFPADVVIYVRGGLVQEVWSNDPYAHPLGTHDVLLGKRFSLHDEVVPFLGFGQPPDMDHPGANLPHFLGYVRLRHGIVDGNGSRGLGGFIVPDLVAHGFDAFLQAAQLPMSTLEQVLDNTSYMRRFTPLSEADKQLLFSAVPIYKRSGPYGRPNSAGMMVFAPTACLLPRYWTITTAA